MEGINAAYLKFVPGGETLTQVDNFIAAVAVARPCDEYTQPGDFDLRGPQSTTFFDVATELGKALGKDVTYIPITNDAFRDYLVEVSLPEPAANNVAELF